MNKVISGLIIGLMASTVAMTTMAAPTQDQKMPPKHDMKHDHKAPPKQGMKQDHKAPPKHDMKHDQKAPPKK